MKDFDSIWRTQDEISENCPKDLGGISPSIFVLNMSNLLKYQTIAM